MFRAERRQGNVQQRVVGAIQVQIVLSTSFPDAPKT